MTQEELEYQIERQKLLQEVDKQFSTGVQDFFNEYIQETKLTQTEKSENDFILCWNSRLNSFITDVLDDVLTLRKARKLFPLKKD